MQIVMEILVSIFLLIGTFFMLVGSIGMVRLPDLFMRLHAPTKSSTLGLGSFLKAAMIYGMFQSRFGFAELLITLFSFIHEMGIEEGIYSIRSDLKKVLGIY